jgi:hypothetical protein
MGAMTERDILRRQLHDDIIDSLRKRASPPPPQALLAKVLACYAIGRQKGGGAARAVAERYNNDPILLKALAAPGMIGKAAVLPAQTTVAGWAAELSTSGIADFWQVPAPQSVYAQLSSHPGAIRVSLAGRSSIKLPTRAPTPTLCAPFVGEGAPIPVRQMALSTASGAEKGQLYFGIHQGTVETLDTVD